MASLAALTFGPGISVSTLGFLGSLSSNEAHAALLDDSAAVGSLNVSADATARQRRNVYGIAAGRARRRGERRVRSITIDDVNKTMEWRG